MRPYRGTVVVTDAQGGFIQGAGDFVEVRDAKSVTSQQAPADIASAISNGRVVELQVAHLGDEQTVYDAPSLLSELRAAGMELRVLQGGPDLPRSPKLAELTGKANKILERRTLRTFDPT